MSCSAPRQPAAVIFDSVGRSEDCVRGFGHMAVELSCERGGLLLGAEIDPAAGRLLAIIENLKPARSVSLVVQPHPHLVHSFRQSVCGDRDFNDVNHGFASSADISRRKASGATPGEASPT